MMHKQKTKNFSLIAEATKTAVAVLVAGKFETLGSNFSHEIRASEAAGVIATIIRKSFKNHYSSSPLSASG